MATVSKSKRVDAPNNANARYLAARGWEFVRSEEWSTGKSRHWFSKDGRTVLFSVALFEEYGKESPAFAASLDHSANMRLSLREGEIEE